MIKIMLVDDESGFSEALGERLQLRGFDICLAFSGEQAISSCKAGMPDIVLMDLTLPDIGGLEVMEKIKEIDETVEVIVVSGHGIERREDALARGAYSFVMKPIKLVDLVDLIVSAYEQQQQ